jgi:hypothetical protein
LEHFKEEFSEIQLKILHTNTSLNKIKKVNILIVDLFLAPFDPFYLKKKKNITAKSNHAGNFIRKLHKIGLKIKGNAGHETTTISRI